MFENILNLIKEYDTIVIHRHSSPDGDALGSQIGLKHIILDN
ncbi:MAG: bifunctional oligoribonuclease/PAP phosphatase NrnA, partial [Clostridia bacterium]|nr:bifunctional oligoribonuclease/PAP phosphatase NrnA [Clostridia bacterium]